MSGETRLLRAAKGGNRGAFERIVEQYQATICAITFSGTGRLDVSEELAQETFLHAWANLHQLRDLAGFRSWLYSIARNTLNNYHRRKQPVSLDVESAEIIVDGTQGPPEILIRQEECLMLEQAIMGLPPKYREPLVLFCRQQQSVRQVAEVLGLTEATVRTRLHRARGLLREQVAERLERVLKRTGPHQDFTKAVMLAIGGVPIGIAATAKAAASVSGLAVATRTIPAIVSSTGVKIAITAVVMAVGAFSYVHWREDGRAATRLEQPIAVSEPAVAFSLNSADPVAEPEPADQVSSLPPVDPIVRPNGGDQDAQQADHEVTDEEDPVGALSAEAPETIVTGTVLDRNTRDPIAGAEVGFVFTETVPTDSEGRFKLSYQGRREETFVHVSASGYATQRINLRLNPGGRQDILFKLQPGMTLVGTVVDPNRDPIENARVRVFSDFFGYEDATTNDRGQFRVEGLNPEDALVYVSAEHADYVSEASTTVQLDRLGPNVFTEIVLVPRLLHTVFSGQVLNARSEPVPEATVGWLGTSIKTTTDREGRYTLDTPDAESPVLFITHAEYPILIEDVAFSAGDTDIQWDVQLEKARPLSGRIVDEAGSPVSDAAIGIESHRDRVAWGWAGVFHSDPQGYFTIPNAPAQGDYRLLAFGNGILRTWHTVDSGQDECLIVASRSGRIYGRMVDGDTGHPIPCFCVLTESGEGLPAMWSLEGYTFTSEEGCFDTGGLELVVGEALPLTVYADGYAPLTLDAVPVQVISDRPVPTVFRLQHDDRRSVSYVGRVVDEEGQAIQGAEVAFRLYRETRTRRGFSRVRTDALGTYMISSVDPHEQVVFVRAPGYAPFNTQMSELLLETSGVFADVVLDPAATLSGYVWGEDGRAVAHARVAFIPLARSADDLESMTLLMNFWPQVYTDEQGYYELNGLPAGRANISVQLEDYRGMAPQEVALNPGDAVVLNFGDPGGFVISGVVTDGADALEQVEVQLKPLNEDAKSHFGRTDAAGQFKLIDVPAGKYVFAALIPLAVGDPDRDPNDTSHVLYKVMEIQSDLDLAVDYQIGSIREIALVP